MSDLSGPHGVIVGVANKRSLAWAIAQAMDAVGAQLTGDVGVGVVAGLHDEVGTGVADLQHDGPDQTPAVVGDDLVSG